MSFREKVAWISITSYLGVYGFYFWQLYQAAAASQTENFHYGPLLVDSIVVLAVIQIALTVLVAAAKPKEAMAARDEREKLIALKANTIGFYLLVSCVLALCVLIANGTTSFYSANGIFLAVVVAELAKETSQVIFFRLGA